MLPARCPSPLGTLASASLAHELDLPAPAEVLTGGHAEDASSPRPQQPLGCSRAQGSLPVPAVRAVRAGSGRLGRSAAEGAKGLVEPGRSGDLGRLWTAGPVEGGAGLVRGVSPTLKVERGVGIYPGTHLGRPCPEASGGARHVWGEEGGLPKRRFRMKLSRALGLLLDPGTLVAQDQKVLPLT